MILGMKLIFWEMAMNWYPQGPGDVSSVQGNFRLSMFNDGLDVKVDPGVYR